MLGRGSTEVDAARLKLFRTDKVSRLPWTSAVPAPTVLRPLSASNTALCFFAFEVYCINSRYFFLSEFVEREISVTEERPVLAFAVLGTGHRTHRA